MPLMSSHQHENNSPAVKAPETPAQTKHISIKVTDNNNEIVFKIKTSAQLNKLMQIYCDRHGKDPRTVRFLFEGERIQGSKTPDELEMEDGDTIQVFYEQQGGSGSCSGAPVPRSRAGDQAIRQSL